MVSWRPAFGGAWRRRRNNHHIGVGLGLPITVGAMKTAYKVIGIVSLACGAVGVVLPLLPTTPFLLLAGFCFTRSSQRLHAYLYGHPVFGGYLTRYETGALTLSDKLRTLAVLWVGLVCSAIFVGKPVVYGVLGVIGLAVTVHLLLMAPRKKAAAKTVPEPVEV